MTEALHQLIDLLTLEKLDENLYRGQSEATDWGLRRTGNRPGALCREGNGRH